MPFTSLQAVSLILVFIKNKTNHLGSGSLVLVGIHVIYHMHLKSISKVYALPYAIVLEYYRAQLLILQTMILKKLV